MTKLNRILGVSTAVCGIITHISPFGKPWYFASLHIIGTALAPVVILVGSVLGLFGLVRRDGWTAVIGMIGAFFAGRYILKATADHDGFEQAFGSDWLAGIPQERQETFMPDRYAVPFMSPPQLAWQQDVVIHGQGDGALLADVWQPPDNVTRTGITIIYMHGSAWHYADKDMGTRLFFRHLAKRGHVVVDLAYTLASKADLYRMMEDVKRAIVWVKNNVSSLSVDPQKVVLSGGSAGAHLALLAAYTPNHPILQPADMVGSDTAVAGVISYYGFSDMVQSHYNVPPFKMPSYAQTAQMEAWMKQMRFLPPYGRLIMDSSELIPAWLGGTPDEIPDIYHLASPLSHVGPHCPPTLLLNGAYDVVMGPEQHRRLATALRQANIPVVHVEFPYTNHGFDLILPQLSPTTQASLHDVERFLALISVL